VPDAKTMTKPWLTECLGGKISYMQLVNFFDDPLYVLINKYLWESRELNEVDKAALVFHEAIYYMLRVTKSATNSIEARKLVGYIFSDMSIESLKKSLKIVITQW